MTKELNEFTYSLNGFINITEILTESTRFFPSLFQYILPLPLSTEKLFFLCSLARFSYTHTQSHSFVFHSLPIGIIRAFSTFNVRRFIPQSDMLTCFQFFLLLCLSITPPSVLDIHTRDDDGNSKIARGKVKNWEQEWEVRGEKDTDRHDTRLIDREKRVMIINFLIIYFNQCSFERLKFTPRVLGIFLTHK